MALWGGLGQAATVAQLVGADVGGLISMIVQAAVTARQNKKECEHLARRVVMIAELLPHLQDPEVMQRLLGGLDDTLREAHELVTSCQGRNTAYQFILARRQAERFRGVQSRIDSYLFVFPVISHIDITRRLDLIYNILLPNDISPVLSSGSQVAEHAVQEVVLQVEGGEEFTLVELEAATNNFAPDTMIGEGCYGTVYMGRLCDGREVAIKRKSMNTECLVEEDFMAERTILSHLRHKHIIRLFGWCVVEKSERLLVYEYMENGSLYDHLHLPSSSSRVVKTSWKIRIQILLGVSRAIEYLHSHTAPLVIHRDIKSSNILLNASWLPRLSDFGTSVTRWDDREIDCYIGDPVRGTVGYIDPVYMNTGYLRPTSDVYSFGVVMLEMLTGRKAFSEWEEAKGNSPQTLVCFALPIIEAGKLRKVLDRRPTLEPTRSQRKALKLVARTAVRCLRLSDKTRLAMSNVVANLEAALELVNCDE